MRCRWLSLLLCVMAWNSWAEPNTSTYLDWESRYISEGRDNLPRGGIVWSGIDYQNGALVLFESQGVASSEDFVEFNIGIGYQQQLGDWLLTGSYTRLEFFGEERCHDNELALAIDYQAFEWLTPSLLYTYSTEADGAFVELSLVGNWAVNDAISLHPYLMQGWDFGFATAEHNGSNNLQFGLITELALSPKVSLSWHVSRTIAMNDIQHEQGNQCEQQQTFTGLALAYDF
ncbi:hypothetical protein JYB87_18095 [Shewanella avicenniae]|uniref:Outer membrane protein n=1 Tax=Shewanella avicenniae TaxID=2814294 RepID=A0ABX7QSB5_9GAMM|nr:hypothetical protein [Shewanella avicenniae]QSX33593.1 hypothetical protein JYB87_18095 [Shewanella avicenniae]